MSRATSATELSLATIGLLLGACAAPAGAETNEVEASTQPLSAAVEPVPSGLTVVFDLHIDDHGQGVGQILDTQNYSDVLQVSLHPLPRFDPDDGHELRHARGGFFMVDSPVSLTFANINGIIDCSNGRSLITSHEFSYDNVHVTPDSGTTPAAYDCGEGWYMYKMSVWATVIL